MKVQSDQFEIYPALDIERGEIARSPQSQFNSVRDALIAYEIPGISWLHLVDLDLAYARGTNEEVIQTIVEASTVKIQMSGGIKDKNAFEYASRFHPDRINLAPDFLEHVDDLVEVFHDTVIETSFALDVADNRVVSRATGKEFGELESVIRWLTENGCKRIILTEASRDGRLRGVNIDLYKRCLDLTSIPLVASGGVSTESDIMQLADIGVAGAVIGAALHHGTINLQSAVASLAAR